MALIHVGSGAAAAVSTAINVRDFGAVGNANYQKTAAGPNQWDWFADAGLTTLATDDMQAFQTCNDSLTPGQTMYVPPGNYRFAPTHLVRTANGENIGWQPKDRCPIALDSGAWLRMAPGFIKTTAFGATDGFHGLIYTTQLSPATITNWMFSGGGIDMNSPGNQHPAKGSWAGGYGYHYRAIFVGKGNDCWICDTDILRANGIHATMLGDFLSDGSRQMSRSGYRNVRYIDCGNDTALTDHSSCGLLADQATVENCEFWAGTSSNVTQIGTCIEARGDDYHIDGISYRLYAKVCNYSCVDVDMRGFTMQNVNGSQGYRLIDFWTLGNGIVRDVRVDGITVSFKDNGQGAASLAQYGVGYLRANALNGSSVARAWIENLQFGNMNLSVDGSLVLGGDGFRLEGNVYGLRFDDVTLTGFSHLGAWLKPYAFATNGSGLKVNAINDIHIGKFTCRDCGSGQSGILFDFDGTETATYVYDGVALGTLRYSRSSGTGVYCVSMDKVTNLKVAKGGIHATEITGVPIGLGSGVGVAHVDDLRGANTLGAGADTAALAAQASRVFSTMTITVVGAITTGCKVTIVPPSEVTGLEYGGIVSSSGVVTPWVKNNDSAGPHNPPAGSYLAIVERMQ